MSTSDNTVFISYRRKVGWALARLIFNDLRAHSYDVFMDVESIDSGTFDTIILNQIAARGHFIIVLTPGTVERCVEPDDWLRREIEHAIDLQRNIVPVVFDGFSFKDAKPYLTDKLSPLSRYNALSVPIDYFDEGMAKLRKRFLKKPHGELQPTPSAERPLVEQKIEQAATQPAPTEELVLFVETLLSAVPDPCAPDVTLHVFQAIEANPTYLRLYEALVGDARSAVNARIGKLIKDLTGREADKARHVPKGASSLIKRYMRFKPQARE